MASKDIRIRVIYYEIVKLAEAIELGQAQNTVGRLLNHPREIAILHCMTIGQCMMTLVCAADHMRALMAAGTAKDPRGMVVSKKDFPVAWEGWGEHP
jgi:hypothetical protein